MNNKISFPHMGDYYIPIRYIIMKITRCEVITPTYNNANEIKIGSQYSPSEVCMPFKYNLGNYIDALNHGANILIQAGGGCRYGFFAELQAEILERLGYDFRFVNLIKINHVSLIRLYKFAKEVNPKLNIFSYLYYLLQGILMIIYMDKLANYKRINSAKVCNYSKLDLINKKIQMAYQKNKLSIYKIVKYYHKYHKECLALKFNNNNPLKILLIGELYTLMDYEANNNLEDKLFKEGISIYRYTDLTYLLIKKRFIQNKILVQSKKYIKYAVGADGTESVYYALKHAQNGIDGIIHVKSYGCVPELNAIPMLNEISEDYRVPILYLSYDGENKNANIDTKLEAFLDILKAKRDKCK